MKVLSLLVFLSTNSFAGIPSDLVCAGYGSVYFSSESSNSRISVLENESSQDDILTISLEKSTSESVFDGGSFKEKLTKITPHIYLAEGLDQDKKYSGTFVFNSDFSLVSYSQDGEYASFYTCN